MSFAGLKPPTISGFINFIRTTMGIPAGVLPDNSPVIPIAFGIAMDLVNVDIAVGSTDLYTLAVYNLGGSNVINYANDDPSAPVYKDSMQYFQYFRKLWNVNDFLTGVVQSSSDNGSSQSLVVQEAAKMFTLQNLQNLKDPYGRRYLAIAQSAGPTIWALS